MRDLSIDEVNQIAGGQTETTVIYEEGYDYDAIDVVDDIGTMALLGVGINIYLNGALNYDVVYRGATLGGLVGLAYSAWNYFGYKAFASYASNQT